MILDHVALLVGGPEIVRLSLGRLAMPMFFILAGRLSRRLTWRHAAIFVIGFFLPAVVPWIDDPNVLVWYAIGAAVLAAQRRLRIPAWAVLTVALTLGANGWLNTSSGSFNPWMLFGLMSLGSMIPRSSFAWAEHLPQPLAVVGRAPLRWYVGHVLALQALVLIGGN